MRREYYLHKRKNGIYYVEFIDTVARVNALFLILLPSRQENRCGLN